MRIERITIRGLASLRDSQPPIDLAGPTYAQAGLIAVTGPTGAGKSTVFDAVCLPLYDMTPRLCQRGDDPRDMLSRGATSARVEVVLRLDDDSRILASWSVNRAHEHITGALQPAQIEIRDAESGLVLAAGKQRTRELILEKVGLTFDQFRSVAMLSQGDFARFIQDPPADKAGLLEKLTGTGIYAEISKQAHERHARMRKEIELHEAQFGAIALLSEADIAERTAAVAAWQAEAASLGREIARLDAQQAWWVEQASLVARRSACSRDLADAVSARESLAETHAHWEQARRAQTCAVALGAVDTTRAEVQRRLAATNKARAALPAVVEQAGQARTRLIGAMSRAAAAHAAAELQRDSHRTWSAITPSAVQRIQTVAQAVGHARGEQLRHGTALKTAQASLTTALTAAANDAGLVTTAQGQVATTKEALKACTAELQQATTQGSSAQLTRQAALLERAIEIGTRAAQASDELTRLAAVLQTQELMVAQDQQDAETTATALTQAQQSLASQQQSRDRLVQVAQVVEFRHLLEDGKPCPLCGSTEHQCKPEKEGLVAAADEQIKRLTNVVQQIEKQQKAAAREHHTRAAEVAKQRALVQERQRQSKEQMASWTALRRDLAELPVHPEEAAGLQERLAAVQSQVAVIATLQEQREAAAEAVVSANEHLAQISLLSEQHRTEIATAEKAVELANLGIREQSEAITAGSAQLVDAVSALATALQEPTPESEAVTAWIDSLPKRAAAWSDLVTLVRSTTELHERVSALLGQLPAGTSLPPAAPPTQLTDATVRRLKDDLHEADTEHERAQRGYRELEQAITQSETEARQADAQQQSAHEALLAALNAAQFAHEAEARAAILAPDQMAEMERRLRESTSRHDRCVALLAAADTAYANHVATASAVGIDPAAEDQTASVQRAQRLADMGIQRTTCVERRAAAQAELAADAQRRNQQAAGFAELDRLRLAIRPWADLDALIGHSTGDTFRQVAQALVLDQLLTLANRRLAAIAPRYALMRQCDAADPLSLALIVIDHDQADERRPVATLSGGETFLASLALALALADLKRGRLRLGTLFIDEGFGSLDSDTLDQAMGVLERLQAEQGTQILLISHVGPLQDRIRHQIRVQPLGAGISRLRLQTPDGAWSTEPIAQSPPPARADGSVIAADQRLVLDQLALVGGQTSTRALRASLGWDTRRFNAVIEHLLDERAVVRPAGSKSVALPTTGQT